MSAWPIFPQAVLECSVQLVRKAHNNGRNHLANVRDYYACEPLPFFGAQTHSLNLALGHDKAQSIIDQITASYESTGGPPPGGFGFGPQHLGAPPPNFGPPSGFSGPMPPPMINGGA